MAVEDELIDNLLRTTKSRKLSASTAISFKPLFLHIIFRSTINPPRAGAEW
jgi:hypothetical protein